MKLKFLAIKLKSVSLDVFFLFIIVWIVAIINLTTPTDSFAYSDRVVMCNQKSCFFQTNEPLFDEQNWKPGQTSNSRVTVINKRNDNCNIRAQAKNTTEDPEGFSSEVFLAIRRNDFDIYGKSIAGKATGSKTVYDLFTESFIKLRTINAKDSAQYYFIATFNPYAGNEFQSANTSFNFSLTFECSKDVPEENIQPPQNNIQSEKTQGSDSSNEKIEQNSPSSSSKNPSNTADGNNKTNDNTKKNDDDVLHNSNTMKTSSKNLYKQEPRTGGDTAPSTVSLDKHIPRVLGTQVSSSRINKVAKRSCNDYYAWALVFVAQITIYLPVTLVLHRKSKGAIAFFIILPAVSTILLKLLAC